MLWALIPTLIVFRYCLNKHFIHATVLVYFIKTQLFPATPEWIEHGLWPHAEVNNKSRDTGTLSSCSKNHLGLGEDKDKLKSLLRTRSVWEEGMDESRNSWEWKKKKIFTSPSRFEANQDKHKLGADQKLPSDNVLITFCRRGVLSPWRTASLSAKSYGGRCTE